MRLEREHKSTNKTRRNKQKRLQMEGSREGNKNVDLTLVVKPFLNRLFEVGFFIIKDFYFVDREVSVRVLYICQHEITKNIPKYQHQTVSGHLLISQVEPAIN